jgi:hypothetical protein
VERAIKLVFDQPVDVKLNLVECLLLVVKFLLVILHGLIALKMVTDTNTPEQIRGT